MNSETKIISIIGVITVAIIIIGMVFAGGAADRNAPPVAISEENLIRPDSPRIKGTNAKLQLVEFGDFECPACAMLQPEMKRFLADFGDQVDFVFRVIPIHQNSKISAAAAFAAQEQGKFKEMHDQLFEHQEEWAAYGLADDKRMELFEKYANIIGLDITKFKSDIISKRSAYDARVDQDARDADAMNVQVTPTLIVNGTTAIRGAQSYNTLKGLLEETTGATTVEANANVSGATASSSSTTAAESTASTSAAR